MPDFSTLTRFALYRRVSSQESFEKDLSLPEQAAQQRDYVTRNGGIIVAEFEEGKGISASREDRPEFQRMISAAKSGEFDVLLIHRSNRVFRSRMHAVTYKHLLGQHGIRLASVTESFIGSDDPTDKLLEGIMECFNEWFLENLKAEIGKGLRQAAAQGRQSGAVPYGYQWDREGDGNWAIDPVTSPWVARIFEAFLTRSLAFSEIARELNSLGAPSPGNPGSAKQRQNWSNTGTDWWGAAVKRILSLRQYVGDVHYKGEWYKGVHSALITRDVFDETARRLSGKRVGRSYSAPALFGTGLLLCPHCGQALTVRRHVHKADGVRREYTNYACSTHSAYTQKTAQGGIAAMDCPGFMISEGKVLDTFRPVLEAASADVDPAVITVTALPPMKPPTDNYALMTAMRTELATIPTTRTNYLRIAGKGMMPDDVLAEELASLSAREVAITAEIERLTNQGTIRAEPDPVDAYRLLRALDRDDLTVPQKRDAIRAVFVSITPTADKVGLRCVLC